MGRPNGASLRVIGRAVRDFRRSERKPFAERRALRVEALDQLVVKADEGRVLEVAVDIAVRGGEEIRPHVHAQLLR